MVGHWVQIFFVVHRREKPIDTVRRKKGGVSVPSNVDAYGDADGTEIDTSSLHIKCFVYIIFTVLYQKRMTRVHHQTRDF